MCGSRLSPATARSIATQVVPEFIKQRGAILPSGAAGRLLPQAGEGDRIFLRPGPGEACHWQAGDIAEIGPQNSDADIDKFLRDRMLDGALLIQSEQTEVPLRTLLRDRLLLGIDSLTDVDARTSGL